MTMHLPGKLRATVAVSILLMLVLTVAGCRDQRRSDAHFYFVQMTDTHFGQEGSHREHLARTQAIVEEIPRLPMDIEFVVVSGDIAADNIDTNLTAMQEGLEQFERLDMPVYYIPGNHDLLPTRLARTDQAFRRQFGPMNQVVEHHGVVFILFNSEPLHKDFPYSHPDPWQWLEDRLDDAGSKPVVVVHHAPSVLDMWTDNRIMPSWPTHNQQRWVELLNQHNVIAVLAGHFHRDEHHWLGDVPLYVCPPVAMYWQRQACFRIFEYRDGRLSYRTRYIERPLQPTSE